MIPYPCTIINDRYSGAYSGAQWTAWALDALNVPLGPDDSDIECGEFWSAYEGVVGKGSTPQEALDDLIRQMKP